MRPGSVIVDWAIDQGGGCIATSQETTHRDPLEPGNRLAWTGGSSDGTTGTAIRPEHGAGIGIPSQPGQSTRPATTASDGLLAVATFDKKGENYRSETTKMKTKPRHDKMRIYITIRC